MCQNKPAFSFLTGSMVSQTEIPVVNIGRNWGNNLLGMEFLWDVYIYIYIYGIDVDNRYKDYRCKFMHTHKYLYNINLSLAVGC